MQISFSMIISEKFHLFWQLVISSNKIELNCFQSNKWNLILPMNTRIMIFQQLWWSLKTTCLSLRYCEDRKMSPNVMGLIINLEINWASIWHLILMFVLLLIEYHVQKGAQSESKVQFCSCSQWINLFNISLTFQSSQYLSFKHSTHFKERTVYSLCEYFDILSEED